MRADDLQVAVADDLECSGAVDLLDVGRIAAEQHRIEVPPVEQQVHPVGGEDVIAGQCVGGEDGDRLLVSPAGLLAVSWIARTASPRPSQLVVDHPVGPSRSVRPGACTPERAERGVIPGSFKVMKALVRSPIRLATTCAYSAKASAASSARTSPGIRSACGRSQR